MGNVGLGVVEGMDGMGDAVKVGGGHGGAGWETEAIDEQFLGDGAAFDLAVLENRLQVHGFPQGAGFDVSDSSARLISSHVAPNCS